MSNVFEKDAFSNGMFEENKEAKPAAKDKEKEDFDKRNTRDIIKAEMKGKTLKEKKIIMKKMVKNLTDDLAEVLKNKEKETNQNKKAA